MVVVPVRMRSRLRVLVRRLGFSGVPVFGIGATFRMAQRQSPQPDKKAGRGETAEDRAELCLVQAHTTRLPIMLAVKDVKLLFIRQRLENPSEYLIVKDRDSPVQSTGTC